MNTIYFTAQEVAVMLGVSRGQAYKLVNLYMSRFIQ